MRASVIASDIFVTLPAGFAIDRAFYSDRSVVDRLRVLAAFVLQPAALLIDHAHFQYNNIGLGLSAAGAAAVAVGYDYVGSVLFCLALNHKQMTMYYAPAFFSYLLGKCLRRPSVADKAAAVARLGCVVALTFAAVWLPFLREPGLALQVLRRLVPVQRGLFEDYVANWWCVSHAAVKWKRLFSQPQLWRMCAAATLLALLPSAVQQARRPSRRGLLLCMANSAFAFFLLSYQVHEKSILLPLMPVTAMACDEPFLAAALPVVASFSMHPLLRKDGASVASLGANLVWIGLNGAALFPDRGPRQRLLSIVGLGAMASLLTASLFTKPPERYPFLYDLIFECTSFLVFAAATIHLNLQQWRCAPCSPSPISKKQQ